MINVIAELGINHQGDMNIMKKLITTAKNCGANYVKGQKREPKDYLSEEQYNMPYDNINSFGNTYGEHKEFLEFSVQEWEELFNFSEDIGIKLFASVFDVTSAKNMNQLGMEIYKIGSGEVTNLELIQEIKSYNKPVIISTGMSSLEEIDAAINIFDQNDDLVIMHTTSCYPCKETDINLRILETLKSRYNFPVGLSGHYVQGSGAVESAAIAIGATWIERHFTLDRTMKGTDHSASLEDGGLKRVIKSIRSVEYAMGNYEKKVLDCELPTRKKVRGY